MYGKVSDLCLDIRYLLDSSYVWCCRETYQANRKIFLEEGHM